MLFFWRDRNLRYQLRKSIGVCFLLFYVSWFSCAQGFVYIHAGRWWMAFSVLSVSLNDSMAYFAGKACGAHHLIGLSPNKTIEGFIGGAIGNIICTVYVT